MRHNWCIEEGYFVCAKVENVPLTFLVDTGSNVSILNRSVYEQLSAEARNLVQSTNKKLLTVTGETTPLIGQAVLNLEIGAQSLSINILFADIENEGILGLDFLRDHNCDLMLTQNCLKIRNDKIRCFASSRDAQPTCCRVFVSEYCIIPPETEMLVQGFITGIIDRRGSGVIEVDTNFLHKKGLLVAKALVSPSDGTIPLRIANPYDESVTLNKHTLVATYEALDSEELISVNATQTVPNEQHSSPANEIPEYLEELFAKSTQNFDFNQKEEFKQLLLKCQSTFSSSSHDLGRTNLVEYEINLVPGTKPIKQAPYRLPLAKRQDAENEIKLMAEKDLIEPSTSPWSAPVIIVPKKNGSIRFWIDYRKLNKVNIQDSQALPRIDDSLDALGGATWYSTLDLRSGFHQIGIKMQDPPKTAFCIPGGGLWQFKVMPFGSTNSPAVFERLMERVFTGLNYKILLIYLDDIIVYGKTFETQLENLREVFQRLSAAKLKLNPEKCLFFQKQCTFLGHLVSADGIKMDPSKIKSVQEWPVPTNVSEVRSFVGLCSYLRRFIPGFSTICKPLHVLTEKGHKFQWTEKCEVAFNTLKTALISDPVLAFPQENAGQFIIDCDASNVALGAVLSHVQDGEEKVIAYYSKCFSRQERRYCTTRKELMAVVMSIKHFHHYMYGRHFLVRSDHNSLRWLMNSSIVEGQLARWLEFLASYDFEIQFRKGISHKNADSLSRRPCYDNNCRYCERVEEKCTGLITRGNMEKSIQGETLESAGLVKEVITDTVGLDSLELGKGKSYCSVGAQLHGQSSERGIPVCTLKGGINVNTSPIILSHNCQIESDTETKGLSGSSRKSVDQADELTTQQLDKYGSKMSVDRPEDPYTGHLFESSAFPEILHEASASAGNLIDQALVSRQPEMGYTEDYLCCQEGQNMDDYLKPQSEEIAVRQTDIIDIDSLESENMRVEQDNDPIIGLVKRWKISGRKPIWQDVA